MGVPCCNSSGTRISPTAGDDVDEEVSTPVSGWSGGSPSVGLGGELIVGDCCFDVVINFERSLKVCSLRFSEPRDDC